jgi:hypothetical protein
MSEQPRETLPREINSLILQALVRRLLAKGILSQEDIGALLTDAVASLADQSTKGPERPEAG